MAMALPLDKQAFGDNVSDRTQQQVSVESRNVLESFGENIMVTEAADLRGYRLARAHGIIIKQRAFAEMLIQNKSQHKIRLFNSWEINPSLHQTGITTPKEAPSIIVLPLGFLLAFLIGVVIKATHWWNEDIRYADGLMVNVYNPNKTHRKVLMKVYSTERTESGSHCRSDNTPPREPIKVLPGKAKQRYILEDLTGEDAVFSYNNVRGVIRPEADSLSTYAKTKSPSYGARSPTESLCSRCRQLEVMGSQHQINEKDINNRYYNEHILELCKLATVSSSLAMRRFQRQRSLLSTNSTVTVNGEMTKESVALLVSKRNRSCGKLNRQGTPTERTRHIGRKASSDINRKLTTAKKTAHHKKADWSAHRTASESQLGMFSERGNSRTDICDENGLLGIDALLKNSIQLNLDILHSLNASRNRAKLIRPCGTATPEGRRCNHLESDPASPNRTSRGSSSYLSSSDITYSNTTSTRTSATALMSSHSSAGSLCQHPSRRQSKKRVPYPNERHKLEHENNPKAFSVPSLKLSNKDASMAAHTEKSRVLFTIGNQDINTSEPRCAIRRTQSSSAEVEWASNGRHNMAVYRSMSLNSSLDCKQISASAVNDIKPSVESTRSRDVLIA